MNTVQEIEKKDCTGCKLCESICPVHAVSFSEDAQGFWYPQVKEEVCIKCGKCVKRCPSLHHELRGRGMSPKVYAAWTRDDEIRFGSTSGGIFYELGQWFIRQGGVVAGCRYTSDWRGAEHIVAEDMKGLREIMGSKYFQSDTSGVYSKVKKAADEGRLALFAGAPCQVNAMRTYLGKEYPNVYFMDFICRSINSPKAFKAYIDELEKTYQSRAVRVRLKDKTRGWQSLASHVWFENGRESLHDRNDDFWIRGFIFHDLYTRESCCHCRYRRLPRVAADITTGDFWGISGQEEEDMRKGISVLLLNTEKGDRLFSEISDRLIYERHTIPEVIKGNPALLESPVRTAKQDQFYRMFKSHPFSRSVNRCIHKSLVEKGASRIKACAGMAVKKAKRLQGISIGKFVFYNFLSRKVVRKGGWVLPDKNAVLDLHKTARIYLDKGNLEIGVNKLKGSRAETYIRMGANSVWHCRNGCQLCYGTVLEIKPNAAFDSGFFWANSGSVIIADKKVTFGEDLMLGRNVIVYDSDFHQIRDENGLPVNAAKEVEIGDHVWLTSNIVVLKGTTIGRGSLIMSGTVITKSVPEHSIVAGRAAGVVMEGRANWDRALVRETDAWFAQNE